MPNLIWKRIAANSHNNFDLVLTNPDEVEREPLTGILNAISATTHRGLTLSSRAIKEFERWISDPASPLSSDAIVLLSNWFMTRSGDRLSAVATRCEELWDVLFPCRPLTRLSSPKPGQNYLAIPASFENFWQRVLEAQGEHSPSDNEAAVKEAAKKIPEPNVASGNAAQSTNRVTVTLDKSGLRRVEGSPKAVADFLQLMNGEGLA